MIQTVTLNTGAAMPLVGLGTAHLSRDAGRAALRDALAAGYRLFDCAKVYGNEPLVGHELRRAMMTAVNPRDAHHDDADDDDGRGRGGIGREELFVVSKLWNDDHAPEDVATACRRSLRDLGLDYLDLYLVHWPLCWRKGTVLCPGTTPMHACWSAMEKLVDEGLVRAIGVSNFDEHQLRALVNDPRTRIRPAVNQVELHPLLQQQGLVASCLEMGVVVTAWSPLGKGAANILKHPTLRRIAAGVKSVVEGKTSLRSNEESDWTAADVALRFNVQRGVAVIPKSTSKRHLARNLRAADGSWSLSVEDMSALLACDRGRRRVPDLIGVWPASCHPAARVCGWLLAALARIVFAVVPNALDLKAPQ